jgi:UMF1 family MFS transporter
VLFAIVGFLFGALGNVMRACFLLLLPPDRIGQYFGLFASFQRFSTLVGPLVWILVALGFHNRGVDAYRASMLSMAVLIGISLFFLKKVDDNSGQF